MFTIIFDLDGTLVDTAPDLIDALNFTLKQHRMPTLPLRGGSAADRWRRASLA